MSDYNLQSLQLPKLTGRALRLFAAALDNPVTRAALLPSLLRQGGVVRLRSLRLNEDPTLYPYAPAAERASRPLSPAEVEATLGPRVRRPPFATARDYAAAYREAATTPLDVAEKVLVAIATSDAAPLPLRAFVANDREDGGQIRVIRRSSRRRSRGGARAVRGDARPVTGAGARPGIGRNGNDRADR